MTGNTDLAVAPTMLSPEQRKERAREIVAKLLDLGSQPLLVSAPPAIEAVTVIVHQLAPTLDKLITAATRRGRTHAKADVEVVHDDAAGARTVAKINLYFYGQE